ncbi:hypothetical protein ABE957_16490 [Halomonas sp. CS7]|uniref:VCBS repeat-containing protein n=1 Tax=Halomonas pelophila TaxID=3151122 RepID=A0ABV1N948_9GAMM
MMQRGTLSLCVLLVLMASSAQAERIIAARYAEPAERYGHYALGRPHEYARLVATTDAGRDAVLALPADEVFEDLAPRLVRLADQAPPALLVIVSARDGGSRLALVGLDGRRLEIVAQSVPIGRPNRWLNPVGVADLSGDGEAEIAAVTTPHIGGVLRVYRRRGERLVEIASLGGFSNHVYGASQLALSRPARIAGRLQLLVPDRRRETIRVIRLTEAGLVESARCRPSEPVTGPEALDDCERRLNQEGSVGPGHPGRPSISPGWRRHDERQARASRRDLARDGARGDAHGPAGGRSRPVRRGGGSASRRIRSQPPAGTGEA